MKKYLPLTILIIFIFVIGLSTYKINRKQDFDNKNNITKTALPNFNLPDLFEKNDFINNSILTKHYSLINFFASWCRTCREEHGTLMQLHNEKIINIYGIAFRDIDNNTKDFLNKYGNPYTRTAKDSQGAFSKSVNVGAVPETLLIDSEGNIIKRYQGNLQNSMIAEIKKIIKSY